MHYLLPPAGSYALLLAVGLAVSALAFWRSQRRQPELGVVFLGGLCGAFIGAKIAYLFAEGFLDWQQPDRWVRFATGKSIIGGLLGGYAGVEWVKHLCGIRRPTGDAFALACPLGLILGRIGCCLHGCCGGIILEHGGGHWRWPAPRAEAGFLLGMLLVFHLLHRRRLLQHRLFFVFLIAYGGFRFVHEWLRETPKWWGWLSGYQILCLVMAAAGWRGLVRRTREMRRVISLSGAPPERSQ